MPDSVAGPENDFFFFYTTDSARGPPNPSLSRVKLPLFFPRREFTLLNTCPRTTSPTFQSSYTAFYIISDNREQEEADLAPVQL